MSGSDSRANARSGLLWLALLTGAVILLAIALEAAGLIYFAAKEGGLFYAVEREPSPARRHPARQPMSVHRFDPYFGFTLEREISMLGFLADARTRRRLLAGGDADGGLPAWTRMRTNNFGFFSPVDYPVTDPDAVLVGIFGGSAARMLAQPGAAAHGALREAGPCPQFCARWLQAATAGDRSGVLPAGGPTLRPGDQPGRLQ